MLSVFGSEVGEEEIAAVTEVMRSQWMGFGAKVSEFENLYCHKFNINNFALVDSGSNALFMAVRLLDLPPASEIIVPSFTWVSCAQAVVLAGHIPVFCDVCPETMNIKREFIEAVRTNNTKAIMVVHYAGLPVDLDPIIELGLPVIEDAAHAIASTYNGITCGAIGDIGIYSFDAVKNLTVGEGGGIVSRNPALIKRAKILRYCGIGKSGFESATGNSQERWWEYNIQEPFIKMLPTNIAAAIGIEQLKKIDRLQAHRKMLWDAYNDKLKHVCSLTVPQGPKSNMTHSYFTYCIRARDRDGLSRYLLANDIYTTLRYHPLHLNPLYKQHRVSLPNSEQLNLDALSLPLHPRVTLDDVDLVSDLIHRFYS